MLPDGAFELIINLEDRPRKIFDRQEPSRYEAFQRGWLAGAQAEYLAVFRDEPLDLFGAAVARRSEVRPCRDVR